MTAIVGITTEGGAILGYDSASSNGETGRIDATLNPKARQLTEWLAFGFTWSWRYGQILMHHVTIDDRVWEEGVDEYEWVVTQFIPAARAALKEHGYMKKTDEREEAGQMLLAVRNRLFVFQSDLSVTESGRGFDAVGSGADEAKGALHALQSLQNLGGMDPGAKVMTALSAAADLNAFVRTPFRVLETRA